MTGWIDVFPVVGSPPLQKTCCETWFQWTILVYYNLGLLFLALPIVSFYYNTIVIVLGPCSITTTKSDVMETQAVNQTTA